MRWSSGPEWKRRFAFIPMEIEGVWHWLEPYWARPGGDCIEVSFDATRPAERLPAPGGGEVEQGPACAVSDADIEVRPETQNSDGKE